jgi:hypothetical protein
MLILWNLAFLSYAIYVCSTELLKVMENLVAKILDSSKSIVIFVVMTLGLSGFFIEAFILNTLLVIRGKKILDLMKSQTFEYIENRSEKKIGFFIALIQFLVVFSIQLFICLFYYNIAINSFRPLNIKAFLSNTILFALLFNSQTIIISLIAYQSYIVSTQLSNISNNFSQSNLQNIYQFICKTNSFIKKLDQLISIFIFAQITINTTICMSFLCTLAIDPKKYLVSGISSILESLTLLISTCLICDIIPKSFKKFYDNLQEFLSQKVFINQLDYLCQHSLLNEINVIKQDIGFTAIGLFKVSTNTIISCLAFVLSYLVILLQTSNQK